MTVLSTHCAIGALGIATSKAMSLCNRHLGVLFVVGA